MALDCARLSEFLFRRTPDWDLTLAKDRYPFDYTYNGLYQVDPWKSFTGDTHTWDRVHVTMPNDDGCWDQMDSSQFTDGNCNKQNMCDPYRSELGWGSDRATYGKYHRDYQTKPFCLDKLRHVEQAKEQLSVIVEGLKAVPDQIVSNFLRLRAVIQSDFIWLCGSNFGKVAVTPGMFTNNCTKINMGSAVGGTGLPTSKLTMQYLNHYAPTLMYQGYFNRKFLSGGDSLQPGGKFQLMTDIQTQQELSNANPALANMYQAADFAKGGKFFAYGVMGGVGDWLMKVDTTPLRFVHVGGGVLQRVFPYQNVTATVGKKPQFDPLYENAPYQLSHVYARQARQVFSGEVPSVNPDMPFLTRNLMGKWSWKTPEVIIYTDPNSGTACTYRNDKKNRGYFLGEYELGMKTLYPEIEMWILHLREPQAVSDIPNSSTFTFPAALSGGGYQSLTPYNSGCDTSEEV